MIDEAVPGNVHRTESDGYLIRRRARGHRGAITIHFLYRVRVSHIEVLVVEARRARAVASGDDKIATPSVENHFKSLRRGPYLDHPVICHLMGSGLLRALAPGIILEECRPPSETATKNDRLRAAGDERRSDVEDDEEQKPGQTS